MTQQKYARSGERLLLEKERFKEERKKTEAERLERLHNAEATHLNMEVMRALVARLAKE